MNGILVVDKPKGPSSHDIVDFIRKRFGLKKVGHAGTLDPQVSGVLVILIGSYTKKSNCLSGQDKEYQACLRLGLATDSLDSEGRITRREKVGPLKIEQVGEVFSQFLGEAKQVPPMFSALRHKGQRLYKLARMGKEVARPPRQIHIYKLRIDNFELPDIHFTVKCSKGTYIRSLCADIADRLGYPGYMSELRRTHSGEFGLSQAVTLDKLKNISVDQLPQILIQNEGY